MACFPKVSEHYFQIPLSQPSITKLSWWDRMTNNPGPVPISSMHQNGFIEECTSDDGISSNQCLLCISIKLNFFLIFCLAIPLGYMCLWIDPPVKRTNNKNFYWTSHFFKLERLNNILFIHFLFPAILWGFCPKTLFIAKFWPIWIKAAFIGGREGDRRKVWPRDFRRRHPGNGENIHCEHFTSDHRGIEWTWVTFMKSCGWQRIEETKDAFCDFPL